MKFYIRINLLYQMIYEVAKSTGILTRGQYIRYMCILVDYYVIFIIRVWLIRRQWSLNYSPLVDAFLRARRNNTEERQR